MKAFPYPLRRVHDARIALLNRCESLLAEAERRRQQCQNLMEECLADIRKQANTTNHKKQHTSVDFVRERVWFEHLVQELDRAIQDCAEQDARVIERRNLLNKALQDCKVIENLTKRQKRQWVLQRNKMEQNEQDENAVITFARRQGNHAPHTSLATNGSYPS